MCDVRSVQRACELVLYSIRKNCIALLFYHCSVWKRGVCVCVSDKNQLKVPDLNADSLLEIENSLS